MNRKLVCFFALLLVLVFATPVSMATAVVVEGSGGQIRGNPGRSAELSGKIFVIPKYGTITNIEGEGTAGFWIETNDGGLIANFGSFNEAMGYGLQAGSYRVLPNLKENPKAERAWVRIYVTCP